MAETAFGLFDWIDRAAAPLHQLYEERLQLLEVADKADFFCYHLAEHHATPLGMAPSPALFLAAAAQRTQRIRLGPLVCLLPLYNPLRLIEQVSMLHWHIIVLVMFALEGQSMTGQSGNQDRQRLIEDRAGVGIDTVITQLVWYHPTADAQFQSPARELVGHCSCSWRR
jgi:hypothetical protein